jgi:DNA primase
MRYAPVIEKNFTVTGRSGEEFLCMCPWHGDTSQGHLYVNGNKGVYLCMSCGTKGHLDRLGMSLPQVSTQDVRERLRAMQKPRREQHFYPESWLKQFDIPHPYWTDERGLPAATVRQFRLGYDPFSNRLTLPLRDMHGRILGVTHRHLDPDARPKYTHPKGFPIGRHLYGAWLLDDQRKVALVEGQVDAVRCWSARVPALSMMGSRLTRDQIKVLKRLGIGHVVLMLDNDSAGIKGTLGVHEALAGHGIRVTSGWYRDYWFGVKDTDGLSPQRLRKMFHSAVPMDRWAAIQEAA